MNHALHHFREIWLADFEFCQPEGERPAPLCLVAREFRSGRTVRAGAQELAAMPAAPFPTGPAALFVAYYASAELSCFLALDWRLPARVLDLFAEFRCLTNGRETPCGNGLLGALAAFGLGGVDAADKEAMRTLAQRGGPYTPGERQALLDYCETDVAALAKLLPAMLSKLDLPRALLRGRYMAAAARMEWHGSPIDATALASIRANWQRLKCRLVREIDSEFGVFVPTGRRIDPNSRLGAAIFQEAGECDIDPYKLAEALEIVWRDERAMGRHDTYEARRAARQATGLTVNRIDRWENAGKDHSTWPGLDVKARELAGAYPELGIGGGYVAGDNYDDSDHAGKLWELLRWPEAKPTKQDRALLARATGIAAHGLDDWANAQPLTFSAERFAGWLVRCGIPWPRLESGALALDDDAFRQMSKAYPAVAPLRELRHALGELRLFDLSVGRDGRNRCLLSAFRSITGRNQPSNARFIFGPSCWLRGLLQPASGRALAYVDWSQQEFGIAAALSGDAAMLNAYTSGDPYLTFAKQARAVPSDATKQSHKQERERFKVCALAVQYGMGSKSLAQALGQPEALARELLRLHRATYPTFWRWSASAVDHAMLHGWLQTVFGWRVQVGAKANPRSLANFPMQANGAEMLRLACCLATERGLGVCAPVHDALLVEGADDEIETVAAQTQAAMAEASRVVLAGLELRTDAKIVRHPERYMDQRGERMWETVSRLLAELAPAEPAEMEVDF